MAEIERKTKRYPTDRFKSDRLLEQDPFTLYRLYTCMH